MNNVIYAGGQRSIGVTSDDGSILRACKASLAMRAFQILMTCMKVVTMRFFFLFNARNNAHDYRDAMHASKILSPLFHLLFTPPFPHHVPTPPPSYSEKHSDTTDNYYYYYS